MSSTYISDGVLDRSPLTTPDGLRFVYAGEAQKVEVQVMEDRFPAIGAMTKIDGSNTWYVETDFDQDGSLEYKLAVTATGVRDVILDPLNPDSTLAPFGSNSVATGPRYAPPTWLSATPSERGSIEPFPVLSKVWNRTMRHEIYLPSRFSPERPLPLLIMHDGPEYVRYAGLARCLDTMISEGSIPPLVVLLHAPHQRNVEYVDNEKHARHLFDEVIPLLGGVTKTSRTFAGGASLGAVASLFTGYRNPGAFEGVLLQSGSFVWKLGGRFQRGPVLGPVAASLPELTKNPDRLPGKIVMSCGTYDGLVEDHRTLVPILTSQHPDVSYSEINAGHHWRCWRDLLESDLLTLLANA